MPWAAGSHGEGGPPAGHSGPTQSWKPRHGARGPGAGRSLWERSGAGAANLLSSLREQLRPPRSPLPSRPSCCGPVSPSAPTPALAWTPRSPPTTSPGSERSRGPSPLSPHSAECPCADRAHPHPPRTEAHQPGSSRFSIRPFQPGFPKTSSPSDFLPKS